MTIETKLREGSQAIKHATRDAEFTSRSPADARGPISGPTLAWMVGVAVVALLAIPALLAMDGGQPSDDVEVDVAPAAEAPRVAETTASTFVPGSAPSELPVPEGMALVGEHTETLGGMVETDDGPVDAGPPLTVTKTSFVGDEGRKLNVLRISGGEWDLENELRHGGFPTTVAGRYEGILNEGGELTILAFPFENGDILQLVARGGISSEDLLTYAARVVGESK